MTEVYSVDKLDLAIEKSLPPNLIITAEGTVNTGGWSNFSLSMVVYIDAPDDGIQEYIFVGTKPTGNVTEGFESEKVAVARIEELDKQNYWGDGKPLKGIRVKAYSNSLEKKL